MPDTTMQKFVAGQGKPQPKRRPSPDMTSDDVDYPSDWDKPQHDKTIYTGFIKSADGHEYQVLHDSLGQVVTGMFKDKK